MNAPQRKQGQAPAPEPLSHRRALSIEEAASTLGVNPEALRLEIAAGRFPAIRFGRRILIPSASLDRYLASADLPGSGDPHVLALLEAVERLRDEVRTLAEGKSGHEGEHRKAR